MPELESFKMTELIKKLRGDILIIEEARNARLFKEAGVNLQQIYKLHLSDKKTFADVDFYLKSLYKSYNYAAAMISEAVKKRIPIGELARLDECLEVMIHLCDKILSKLNKKK